MRGWVGIRRYDSRWGGIERWSRWYLRRGRCAPALLPPNFCPSPLYLCIHLFCSLRPATHACPHDAGRCTSIRATSSLLPHPHTPCPERCTPPRRGQIALALPATRIYHTVISSVLLSSAPASHSSTQSPALKVHTPAALLAGRPVFPPRSRPAALRATSAGERKVRK